ncbi:MAG: ABC transporter ATP-binding protein [Patescibacteria group bacterium]|nr:ABC transporter ATP-binding protein [Patescibacteria group bacterium]
MLTCLQLKKYFGGIKAVDSCSFEVKPQTITALIGPNGAGKSTVFNLVSGILKTDSGKILFKAGKQISSKQISGEMIDITNKPPERISNLGISRLFQQTKLFNNLTVRENLLLAFDNEDTKFWKNLVGLNKISKEKEQKIKEMLKLVEMEKFENTLARDLSYGQKRLIELWRTILNPHKFLMLDEPVSGVRPKLREEIARVLLKLRTQGETILVIEHDMNFTLKIADRVIVMEKGKVIAQGQPEEIKNNPRVLEAYLGE